MDFLPFQFTTEHWEEFPVLYNRFSLVIYFIYSVKAFIFNTFYFTFYMIFSSGWSWSHKTKIKCWQGCALSWKLQGRICFPFTWGVKWLAEFSSFAVVDTRSLVGWWLPAENHHPSASRGFLLFLNPSPLPLLLKAIAGGLHTENLLYFFLHHCFTLTDSFASLFWFSGPTWLYSAHIDNLG